jgi:transcriptional regulator with XRE-family HTH domain
MDERMPARKPPTVRLRRLGGELKRLRTAAGLTRETVAERTRLDTSSIYRIEAARNRPQRRTVLTLLDLYGVTEPTDQAQYIEMLAKSNELNWLLTFEDVLPESYQTFINFEAEADRLEAYEGQFMPGLLQTEAYARAVIQGLMPEATAEDIERRVEVRARRQAALEKSRPVGLWAILDEGVIRRTVGGDNVHQEQLRHLLDAVRKPNITLQVVPFGAGAHPGMPGAFVVMAFPDPDPPLVYTENAGGGLFLEGDLDVQRYRASFQRLAAQALSPKDAMHMIKQAASAA